MRFFSGAENTPFDFVGQRRQQAAIKDNGQITNQAKTLVSLTKYTVAAHKLKRTYCAGNEWNGSVSLNTICSSEVHWAFKCPSTSMCTLWENNAGRRATVGGKRRWKPLAALNSKEEARHGGIYT